MRNLAWIFAFSLLCCVAFSLAPDDMPPPPPDDTYLGEETDIIPASISLEKNFTFLGKRERVVEVSEGQEDGKKILFIKTLRAYNLLGLVNVDATVFRRVDASSLKVLYEDWPWWSPFAEAFSLE